jgi:hypothetical protein
MHVCPFLVVRLSNTVTDVTHHHYRNNRHHHPLVHHHPFTNPYLIYLIIMSTPVLVGLRRSTLPQHPIMITHNPNQLVVTLRSPIDVLIIETGLVYRLVPCAIHYRDRNFITLRTTGNVNKPLLTVPRRWVSLPMTTYIWEFIRRPTNSTSTPPLDVYRNPTPPPEDTRSVLKGDLAYPGLRWDTKWYQGE